MTGLEGNEREDQGCCRNRHPGRARPEARQFHVLVPELHPHAVSIIERIVKAVEPFEYDRVCGAFVDRVIKQDGKAGVKWSAERYQQAIGR